MEIDDLSKIKQIKQEVKKEVLPGKKEIRQSKNKFNEIKEFIKNEFDLKSELMGSVAKDTFLEGNKDLDIFVFFPESVDREKLEETGLEVGEKVFKKFGGKYEVDYAEHPYTKGKIDGFEVEIVPCYRVETSKDLKSAVDRTPFHTKWVNKNLNKKQKEETTVLKAWLKGTGLYGSSLKKMGFSGYLCELLIAEFGTLENLLRKSQNWEYKEKLDPKGHWKQEDGQINVPKDVWRKFKEDSLIVIDPVDKERNVASVLSEENYARFIYQAWLFLEKPDIGFFFPTETKSNRKEIDNKLKRRGKVLIVEFGKPDLIDDILFPQLRKIKRRIENKLQRNEFKLFDSGIYVGQEKVRLVFDLSVWQLPQAKKQLGPRIFHNQNHLEQFKDKYERVWVEDSRLVTIIERDQKKAKKLLENFLDGTDNQLKERGIPENIAEAIKKSQIKAVEDIEPEQEWNKFLYKFLQLK